MWRRFANTKANWSWTHHSCRLWTASWLRGLSSASAVQRLRGPVGASVGAQDTVCPVDCGRGPLRTSQHSWLPLHSPLDDISSWVTSLQKGKKTPWNPTCTAHTEHLTPTATSVSCNSRRDKVNWVWTSMKDTANSHLSLCIWKKEKRKVFLGARRQNEAMLVFTEFQILHCFFSRAPPRLGPTAVARLFVYTDSTFNHMDASLQQLSLFSAAANLSICTVYKEQTFLHPEQTLNTSMVWIQKLETHTRSHCEKWVFSSGLSQDRSSAQMHVCAETATRRFCFPTWVLFVEAFLWLTDNNTSLYW